MAKEYYLKLKTDGAELVPELRESFFKVGRIVATCSGKYDPCFFRQLSKPMHCPDAWCISRLGVLCKSHKPPGQLTWSNIHASSNSAMLGLSVWLAAALEKKL